MSRNQIANAVVGAVYKVGKATVTSDEVVGLRGFINEQVAKVGAAKLTAAFAQMVGSSPDLARVMADGQYAATLWRSVPIKIREFINMKYRPRRGLSAAVNSVGKALVTGIVDVASIAVPVLTPLAIAMHKAADGAPLSEVAKSAAASALPAANAYLSAASSVVTKAKIGDPKALALVKDIAAKAKAGDVNAAAHLNVLAKLNAPVAKQAARVVVNPPPKSAAPSKLPGWVQARPMLQGGNPGLPKTWPSWLRADYDRALSEPAIARLAPAARPYAFLNRFGAAVAAGDVPELIVGSSPDEFADSPAMSLINYYQIGAPPVPVEDFYVGCDASAGCAPSGVHAGCVPQTSARSSGSTFIASDGLDFVVGAGGQPLERRWDGLRWVWSELKPRRGYRSDADAFGARDAYRAGLDALLKKV